MMQSDSDHGRIDGQMIILHSYHGRIKDGEGILHSHYWIPRMMGIVIVIVLIWLQHESQMGEYFQGITQEDDALETDVGYSCIPAG